MPAAKFSRFKTFQSTPGYLAGRYAWEICSSHRSGLFQSTPGYLAGRYFRAWALFFIPRSFNPLPAI